MKLLIAEDDSVSRQLLKKILEDCGHCVITALNGKSALEIISKEKINLVIADWAMPIIDGITLCKKIRELQLNNYIYFILLTSKDKKENIIEGLKSGADDYITKPFDRDELRLRINTGIRILDLQDELMLKNEKLEELVRIDVLMNIGNRRFFYEIIQKIHNKAIRYSQNYGIILCDVDDFKKFNDTYGHLAGDSILIKIADGIKKSIRKSDDIFRYGGEEIIIIVPEQNLDNTYFIAEKIRKDIESLNIENKNSFHKKITLSFGVAVFNQSMIDKSIKWENILNFADNALYEAKGLGKNRVCKYQE